MAAPKLADYFKTHTFANSLLGEPLTTGKVTIGVFVGAVVVTYILYNVILLLWRRKPNSASEIIYESFATPLKGAMLASALLLQDPVKDHYRSEFKDFIKRHWLHIIGAALIAAIMYGLAVLIVVMSQGVHLETLQEMLDGDWDKRFELAFHFFSTNKDINLTLLIFYILLVVSHAKVKFLERQFWHLRRSGIRVALPVGEWDETPKLNVPKEELIKNANESVKTLLADLDIDYVRVKLASGYDTIGPQGYLVDLLKRPNVKWDILLMDPDGEGAAKRAKAYMTERASDPPPFKSGSDYTDSIKATIQHLKEIKENHNNNISVRVYGHTPQWRIFIAGGHATVSAFGPGQRSDRAPMIVMENSSTSMFHGFEEMWEDIWHFESKDII